MRHSILVLQHGGHQRAVGPQLSRVLTPPKLKYVSPDALCKRDVTEVWFVAFAFTIRVSTGCSYPSARPRHRRGATVRAHQPHLFSPFTRFFHDFPLRGRTCVFWEAAAESLRQNYGSPSVRCGRPFLVPLPVTARACSNREGAGLRWRMLECRACESVGHCPHVVAAGGCRWCLAAAWPFCSAARFVPNLAAVLLATAAATVGATRACGTRRLGQRGMLVTRQDQVRSLLRQTRARPPDAASKASRPLWLASQRRLSPAVSVRRLDCVTARSVARLNGRSSVSGALPKDDARHPRGAPKRKTLAPLTGYCPRSRRCVHPPAAVNAAAAPSRLHLGTVDCAEMGASPRAAPQRRT
jgi:hypothetical protein